MALLVWFTMGLAIWHFSVFFPDRFIGGIIGALMSSIFGAMLVGTVLFVVENKSINDVKLETIVPAIVGSLLGLALAYLVGSRAGEVSER